MNCSGESKGRRYIICWIGVTTITVVMVLGVLWLAGPLVLRWAARMWVVSDHADQADVIVVLGGGLDIRPVAVAELYNRGIAPRVAVGVSEFDHGREAGLNREMLKRYGVPATAIIEFRFRPHSTYGEARGILKWAKNSGAKNVIIPIEIFQTRRVRWIFNHELEPAHMRAVVQAVTPPEYSVDNWWQNKIGFANFRSELIKFTYYRLRY